MTPVASGQLRRGSLMLAAFEMTAPNTFVAMTTWEQLAGTDLGGQMGEDVSAPASIVMFDQSGAMAQEDVSVTLGCTNATEAVCQGACLDVTDDYANCGGCGNNCLDEVDGTDHGMTCANATCGTAISQIAQRASCDSICSQTTYQGRAMRCASECRVSGSGGLSFSYGDGQEPGWAHYKNNPFTSSTLYTMTTCGDVPVPNFDDLFFDWERCCCVTDF
jgi:hypothetical protein